MQKGTHIIQQFKKRWQRLELLLAFVYALGIALFVGCISQLFVVGGIMFVLSFAIAIAVRKPWMITLSRTTSFLDDHLPSLENSTQLLLLQPKDLSGLAQLQRHKVTLQLQKEIHHVQPKTNLKKAFLIAFVLITLGIIIFVFFTSPRSRPTSRIPESEKISFQSSDSIAPAYDAPVLVNQKLTVSYPKYTKQSSITTSEMNVKVLEGSKLIWQLNFEGLVRKVELEGIPSSSAMRIIDVTNEGHSAFAKAYYPKASGYYNFKFYDSLGSTYISDMYALEIFKDKAPEIELKGIPQFTSFDHREARAFSFTTRITDDYGIATAVIVATVSKGSGESVKFREERLAFDQPVKTGNKIVQLSKVIDLDRLRMDVGDELYFYIEAKDQKTPKPNITRSETFFAVIKDTLSDGFGVEGTLGADLMPDYFRSQRQLIIDTEKLLRERPKLTQKTFASKSNELGFDQKALRLKYGQFMGDEDDSGIAVTADISSDLGAIDDPTAGYRHDHDTEDDHSLAEGEHAHTEDHTEETESTPLEKYVHNHDDPEESTLFTASLRSKLKQAMAEMWDAELHLRLADPKTSLPYQYKALNLIQEIKNTARIYVHRIGFDPPPIKEDKRLTGDLDEVSNVYKSEDIAQEDPLYALRESIKILEDRLANQDMLSLEDKNAFAKAGEQLALLAINEPAKHLTTLQQLKWLTEEKPQSREVWRAVQQGLLSALPNTNLQTSKKQQYRGALEQIFHKELQQRDR